MGRGLPYNMGLMEPGCTHQDFGRDAQPAAPNRPRCRAEFRAKRLDDILRDAQKKWDSRCLHGVEFAFLDLLIPFFENETPRRAAKWTFVKSGGDNIVSHIFFNNRYIYISFKPTWYP